MSQEDQLIDNRKRGWFWEYNDIFASSLSEHAMIVRLFLARCANRDSHEAWPSLNTIVKKCKISKPTVIKAIRELESRGWIHRRTVRKSNDEYENTVYYLEDPPAVAVENEVQEFGSKAALLPGKNEDEGVVKPVDHLVKVVDNPSKAALPGV
jgi:predicted transcriptional regulator